MGTKARTRCRAVGLYRVALVHKALVVKLLEQVPHRLDILVLKGDVGIVEIDPVAHALRDVVPLVFVLHHRLAAGGVVLLYRDRLADVLLGDAEALLYAQLDGQPVGVPPALASYTLALHRLEATEQILDRTRQHVVDTRFAIGRGRPLVEYERIAFRTLRDTALEDVVRLPVSEYFAVDSGQIEGLGYAVHGQRIWHFDFRAAKVSD